MVHELVDCVIDHPEVGVVPSLLGLAHPAPRQQLITEGAPPVSAPRPLLQLPLDTHADTELVLTVLRLLLEPQAGSGVTKVLHIRSTRKLYLRVFHLMCCKCSVTLSAPAHISPQSLMAAAPALAWVTFSPATASPGTLSTWPLVRLSLHQ